MATGNDSTGAGPQCPSKWLDTPERVFAVSTENLGSPFDLLNCVLLRAHAVIMLLNAEFADEDRDKLDEQIVLAALWDIQANLEMAQVFLRRLDTKPR